MGYGLRRLDRVRAGLHNRLFEGTYHTAEALNLTRGGCAGSGTASALPQVMVAQPLPENDELNLIKLVRDLPKVNVANSIRVFRSNQSGNSQLFRFSQTKISVGLRPAVVVSSGTDHQHGHGVLVLQLPSSGMLKQIDKFRAGVKEHAADAVAVEDGE
jgi:hypothetical protein